jgi:hypothetical protein
MPVRRKASAGAWMREPTQSAAVKHDAVPTKRQVFKIPSVEGTPCRVTRALFCVLDLGHGLRFFGFIGKYREIFEIF